VAAAKLDRLLGQQIGTVMTAWWQSQWRPFANNTIGS